MRKRNQLIKFAKKVQRVLLSLLFLKRLGHPRRSVSDICEVASMLQPALNLTGGNDKDISIDIVDRSSAAVFCLNLLCRRQNIRRRFPTALSDGMDGKFGSWITGPAGSSELGLDHGQQKLIREAFEIHPGRIARQAYLDSPQLRKRIPLGLLPPGRQKLFERMMDRSKKLFFPSPEAIAWLMMECAEDPSRELIFTYLFTPEWQAEVPDGATVFGARHLEEWVAQRYHLKTDWLDSTSWSLPFTVDQQIRLAWHARPEWQSAHPTPFASYDAARTFLLWLSNQSSCTNGFALEWRTRLDHDATAAALTTNGLNLIGHFCYPSGLRSSLNLLAESAAAVGIPFSCRNIRTSLADEPRHGEYPGQEPFSTTLIHVQPEPFFERVYELADMQPRVPRTYRIAYWYWEMQVVPQGWSKIAEAVDEIWVATQFVATALRGEVDRPVFVVTPGFQLSKFRRRTKEEFGLSPDRFTFLFVFHVASTLERKNPLGLIEAFTRAFGEDDQVSLVIKTWLGDPAAGEQMRSAANLAHVTIIDELYTTEQTLALIDACDCYVSLHRSEGLGLTMAEAMLLAKPVIATGYSGNMEFMNNANSLLVDYELVRLDQPLPPYSAGSLWADPSLDHAARLMRHVYENRSWARSLGAKASNDLQERFSTEVCGRRIAELLTRALPSHGYDV